MLNTPWPLYLRTLSISGLRGWSGQEIRFEFPVVAVAGENGCGKSTVLKAAAACYVHPSDRTLSFFPGKLFPDTAWEQTSGVTLAYRIRQGQQEREYHIQKHTQRWRYQKDRPRRQVIFQDVSRTLPLDATAGYARIAKRNTTEVSAEMLSPEITVYYSAILGRQYTSAKMAKSNLDVFRPVGVVEIGKLRYSQFHQGAGEDATLDLLSLLQNVGDNSLILIDEVEASLHPRAQRRLVHFLLWFARRKHIQVIVSTHSPYVLEELPPEGRVLLCRGPNNLDVLYGMTVNYALNRMDDVDRPELYVYTEDEESVCIATELLRATSVDLRSVRFMAAGPSNAVETIGCLAHHGKLPVSSIAVLDADCDPNPYCVKLPGTMAPERQVVTDLFEQAAQPLSLRLGSTEAELRAAAEKAMTIPDHHDWVEAMSQMLSQSRIYLWQTMCQVWVRHCVDTTQPSELVAHVKERLAGGGKPA